MREELNIGRDSVCDQKINHIKCIFSKGLLYFINQMEKTILLFIIFKGSGPILKKICFYKWKKLFFSKGDKVTGQAKRKRASNRPVG